MSCVTPGGNVKVILAAARFSVKWDASLLLKIGDAIARPITAPIVWKKFVL